MDDPSLFAGRSEQIEEIARALHSAGACPIIYGDRGLGKSSLALQGIRIALGDRELLDREGHERWAIRSANAFVPIYVRCSDATQTKDQILQRVLNAAIDAFGKQIWNGEETYQLKELSGRVGLDLKLISAEFVKRYEPIQRDPGYVSKNVEDKLLEVCKLIAASTRRRVLLVIDELDRARDAAGLASLIKSGSSRDLKFMLVGIGQSVSELLSDHRSLERSGRAIEVPLMAQPELEAIVDRVMFALRERGVVMGFEGTARRVVANTASGFPWFVHVLGEDSLILADKEGDHVVRATHVQRAAQQLTKNRFAHQFADMYQMAVRDSVNRERVLRMVAKWPGRDIPTGEIYRLARTIGVSNPSTYKGHLCSDTYGRILLTPSYQRQGLVRFANEMFKVYVRVRSSIFEEVDTQVDAAWDSDARL